jgi:hypothetical protein
LHRIPVLVAAAVVVGALLEAVVVLETIMLHGTFEQLVIRFETFSFSTLIPYVVAMPWT